VRLRIRHETIYRYARPVGFVDHRLMISPRQRVDVAVIGSTLRIDPAATLVWSEDALGNAVATAIFAAPATRLTILATHEVELSAEEYPVFRIDPAAHRHPFAYAAADQALFGPALIGCGAGDADVAAWADAFAAGMPDDTMTLLRLLNERIGTDIAYRIRDEEGTQAPAQTIALASGSCRDLAALFLAAVRHLGFAARAVSGYLWDPGMPAGEAGAMHAWCEVYLPQAGWIAFDPTRQFIGNAGLIATAMGASNEAILPITGGFVGDPGDLLGLDVDVRVTAA